MENLMPTKTKGHWPAGKRRNPDSGHWMRVRARLDQLLRDHWRHGVITANRLAADIGVDPRTINRWLNGEDRPSEESQAALALWLRDKLAGIKRTR